MLTPLSFTLLRQLSDGDFHSGEDLAEKVGLTRARVSQLLRQAETAGLSLERVRGRGYRLKAAPDFLDAAAVRVTLSQLGVKVAKPGAPAPRPQVPADDDLALTGPERPMFDRTPPALQVEVSDQIDSTSSELLRRAPRRDIHGAVLAAEWQTAGRGRRGRTWTAVAGGSLTFSMGWRFEQGAGFLAGLSLAAGVAVVRALEKDGFNGIELKWPNDLVFRHHKIGGILIELNGDALGPSTVVVGVGLNVRMPRALRREIAQPVTDLTAVAGRGAPPIDRNRLLARLVAELSSMFSEYAQHGFAPIAAEWQQRHAYQGKPVKLVLPDGGAVKGTVAGVDASGALVLADGPRRSRFLSGELSLRRA
ncbi:MAG: biotin--[acetyl-CoA-carboxylase] ligase [Burkholderiales bacterium]|nr:biotin--[acetyl-CoA-carboxylase] ligase [Burkholderiales bacterium]